MNARERINSAIWRDEPDRVPLDLGGIATTIEDKAYRELLDYLNYYDLEIKHIARDHVDPHPIILEVLNIDTRYIRMKSPTDFDFLKDNEQTYYDEWGIKWHKPSGGLYWDPIDHPFSKDGNIKSLNQYNWPDVKDPSRIKGLKEEASLLRANTDYAIIADMPFVGVFEAGLFLRGFQLFLEDLIANKRFSLKLMEKATEVIIELYELYLNSVGDLIDVIMISDDLGTQQGPIISPNMYRDMIKPLQNELVQSIKKKTKAAVFLHCCGSIKEFIPDFIELGIDIINPVQVRANNMDPIKLKAEFGKDITFWGGVDTQQVLCNGSVQDVISEVKLRIDQMSTGGGYVLGAVHNIQAGVSPENVLALFKTGYEYGNSKNNM